jgi:hypothetical protein
MPQAKAVTHVVAGEVRGKRTSPRVYTHATVVTFDPAWQAAHVLPRSIANARKAAADNYKHYQQRAAGKYVPNWVTWHNISAELRAQFAADDAKYNAEACDLIARYPTLAAFQDKAEADVRVRFAEAAAAGVYEYVQAWHMSASAGQANVRKIGNDGWSGTARLAPVIRCE